MELQIKCLIYLSTVLLSAGFHIPVKAQEDSTSASLYQLRILRKDQAPVAFFFRDAEQVGRRESTSWEEWYSAFSSLMGVEGKALTEEVRVGDYEKVREFFNRLKELHPEQAVILHMCGRARDPEFGIDSFYAGHWAYFVGAVIQTDLPAQTDIMDIEVSDVGLFKSVVGHVDRIEDVGICRLDEAGKPDWSYSEQVRLIDVDYEKGTIKVERGCYGTIPKAFKAGHSYAAAHVYEGPQGSSSNNVRWYYNHSTNCPRDENGNRAGDILAEQVAGFFNEGGMLEALDGVEFDVLHNIPVPTSIEGRGLDLDADGDADGGSFNGYPTYGIGIIHFLKRLRELMGEEKLIMADMDRWFHQRAVGILNGTEHEKFPTGGDDAAFTDWAGGINRLRFWKQNSRNPVFNYIKSKPSDERIADIRLAFAAAVIHDAGISMTIPGSSGRKRLGKNVFIWDELRKGRENELGWLGKAIGPPRRLAMESDNLLSTVDLSGKIVSANCRIECKGGVLKLRRKSDEQGYMHFRLGEFDCKGQDLFVSATVSADPLDNYPEEYARIMHLEVSGGQMASAEGRFMVNNAMVTDKTFERMVRNMAPIHKKPYKAGFYFREFDNPTILTFNFEGNEEVIISDIGIYAAADIIVRKFEGGLVIANPSDHQVSIDLKKIWPEERFRRLKGSQDQDPVTNNGEAIEGKISIGRLDGLFLVREN